MLTAANFAAPKKKNLDLKRMKGAVGKKYVQKVDHENLENRQLMLKTTNNLHDFGAVFSRERSSTGSNDCFVVVLVVVLVLVLVGIFIL
jgi:hypothetical protein